MVEKNCEFEEKASAPASDANVFPFVKAKCVGPALKASVRESKAGAMMPAMQRQGLRRLRFTLFIGQQNERTPSALGPRASTAFGNVDAVDDFGVVRLHYRSIAGR